MKNKIILISFLILLILLFCLTIFLFKNSLKELSSNDYYDVKENNIIYLLDFKQNYIYKWNIEEANKNHLTFSTPSHTYLLLFKKSVSKNIKIKADIYIKCFNKKYVINSLSLSYDNDEKNKFSYTFNNIKKLQCDKYLLYSDEYIKVFHKHRYTYLIEVDEINWGYHFIDYNGSTHNMHELANKFSFNNKIYLVFSVQNTNGFISCRFENNSIEDEYQNIFIDPYNKEIKMNYIP